MLHKSTNCYLIGLGILSMQALVCAYSRIFADEETDRLPNTTIVSITNGFRETASVNNSANILRYIHDNMLRDTRAWMDKNRLGFDDEKKYYGHPFIDLLAHSKEDSAIPFLYQDILLEVHNELKLQPERPCFVLLYNYGPSVTDPILRCIAKSDYKQFNRQTAVIELLKAIYGSDDDDAAIVQRLIERHLRKNPMYGEPERIRLTVFADMLTKSREK